jgi:hypothetical protein
MATDSFQTSAGAYATPNAAGILIKVAHTRMPCQLLSCHERYLLRYFRYSTYVCLQLQVVDGKEENQLDATITG